MAFANIKDWLLEQPIIYKTWMAPFAKNKLAPIIERGDIGRAKRVLDVGCGPGTNSPLFAATDYLGVDINPQYINHARRRYRGRFLVADVTEYSASREGQFDFILLNSLLHHIDTPGVERLLAHLSTLLTPDGHVHIVDLILPPEPASIAKLLARMDRGDHPRPLNEWRRLFHEPFEPVAFEPYTVNVFGKAFWKLIYFKGRAPS